MVVILIIWQYNTINNLKLVRHCFVGIPQSTSVLSRLNAIPAVTLVTSESTFRASRNLGGCKTGKFSNALPSMSLAFQCPFSFDVSDIDILTAIGLTPGGSSMMHIYTQTIHRTTQLTTLVGRLSGIWKAL